MANLHQFIGFVVAGLLSACSVVAQVNLPKQREDVIVAAEAFLKAREAETPKDKYALDPFLGNIQRNAPPVEAPAKLVSAPIDVDSSDLLRRLALSVTASGTAIMGENRFLLTGRQRIMMGETFIIKLNGRDYEVVLSEVTSTTFTIRRNENTYTRAVKL